ncbi:DUF3048 domain-containing protein [soil metagenome]
MNKKVFSALLVVVYLVSAGVSYAVFSSGSSPLSIGSKKTAIAPVKSEVANDFEAVLFDQSKPKTQACPLNGELYSKEQETWWLQHRPLGIMIENHTEARPQSGISFADVTYEAVAEGGITRTLNVFYCNDAGIVGPVRSARTYFLDWISEYGDHPLYTHVGGANCVASTGSGCQNGAKADALGQIEKYGWLNYNDLSQFSIGFPVFKRDEARLGREVATEHTMYSTTTKLWNVAKERGLTTKDKEGTAWTEGFVSYTFKDDAAESERGSAQALHIEFWQDPSYFVDWTYDKASNSYLRKNGGEAHMDRNTKKQLSAKTIVVMLQKESSANDGYDHNAHLLYGNKGTGKALIFMDGKQTSGTWSKDDRTARTKITTSAGKEIAFNRGHLWFDIVPLDAEVSVK